MREEVGRRGMTDHREAGDEAMAEAPIRPFNQVPQGHHEEKRQAADDAGHTFVQAAQDCQVHRAAFGGERVALAHRGGAPGCDADEIANLSAESRRSEAFRRQFSTNFERNFRHAFQENARKSAKKSISKTGVIRRLWNLQISSGALQ